MVISYRHLDPDVVAKKNRLTRSLIAQGYRPRYIVLSGYRPPWLNQIMPLSARKSSHMKGQAIDLLIFDINGNYRFDNEDLKIVSNTLDAIDRKHPEHRGGVGLYHNSFPRMVHFDVSGKHRHWDY